MALRNFDLSGVIFKLWAYNRASKSVGSEAVNLFMFYMLNNLTKDWQKTDICGNLVFI